DDAADRVLTEQGLARDAVPEVGRIVTLRDTANLSTGGEAIDRTDDVSAVNLALLERAAEIIGLDVTGIDVIAPELVTPLTESGGVIIEVNAAPGFRMHLAPSSGQARDVAGPVIDSLFPDASGARIPLVAVTGTNGKSTTTRMLAHILAW